ncbi:tectonic-like complex member MKS1, partial [Uloborus diversus]|uniref:tectonic-like complex member MKS1 n=1 Tax=Uloborus diversus TaxID=327109 RepID=UPI0024090813
LLWNVQSHGKKKIEKSERNDLEENSKESVTISIFTYTDSDVLSQSLINERSIAHPTSSSLSHLERKLLKRKPKSRMNFHDFVTWQKPLFSYGKEIIKKQDSSNTIFLPVGQTLLVMAALFYEDGSSSEEIELCCLRYNDYGTLIVCPDFCKSKAFSFLNSRSEAFEYEFENVSHVLKESENLQEKGFFRKVELQKQKVITDAVGEIFFLPPEDNILFTINCEIVSASYFLLQNIFVHYQIILPEGCCSESPLEGTTETCRSKQIEQANVAYFGYSFSVDVVTKAPFLNRLSSLKVLVEATSVDYWGNFRNEGYGYGDIVLEPGQLKMEILTWKLEPTTLKSKLHNFFIGGVPSLEDISYVISPRETKDAQLSKYGVHTVSSGKVTFTASIIKQIKL